MHQHIITVKKLATFHLLRDIFHKLHEWKHGKWKSPLSKLLGIDARMEQLRNDFATSLGNVVSLWNQLDEAKDVKS